MRPLRWLGLGLIGAILVGFLTGPSTSQAQLRPAQPKTYRLEAVAETKLLMEGSINPNFKGLETNLKDKPANVEAWTFARGQALIIAENGNLLLLRPPKNQQVQDTWYELAVELRQNAIELAKQTAAQDHRKSQQALVNLSNTCNRCHQSFKVQTRITPWAEKKE